MVPKLSKVLSRSKHRFKESDFSVACHRCQHERNISECVTEARGKVRNYRCSGCDDLLVTIEVPAERNLINPALQNGEWWSIRPTYDLLVQIKSEQLTIPARAPTSPAY